MGAFAPRIVALLLLGSSNVMPGLEFNATELSAASIQHNLSSNITMQKGQRFLQPRDTVGDAAADKQRRNATSDSQLGGHTLQRSLNDEGTCCKGHTQGKHFSRRRKAPKFWRHGGQKQF